MYILSETEFIPTCSSVGLAPAENEMDERIANTKLAFLHLNNTVAEERNVSLDPNAYLPNNCPLYLFKWVRNLTLQLQDIRKLDALIIGA